MTPKQAAEEQIIQLCSMMGDGEHKMVALTNQGRLFQRQRDPRSFNSGPHNPGGAYIWVPMKGPLDASE